MRKIKGFWILAAVCCVALLAACSEDDDDFDEPEPSTIDTSVWPITEHMDTLSYRAGDDFFMYCNGNYWKTTELTNPGQRKGFLYTDVLGKAAERKMQTPMPFYDKLNALVKEANDHPINQDEYLQYMAPVIQLISQVSTNEDCIRLLALLAKMGYSNILSLSPATRNGIIEVEIAPTFSVKNEVASEAISFAQQARRVEKWLAHPEEFLDLHPLASTRSDGNDVVTILTEELGIPAANVEIKDSALEVFAEYKNADVNVLKEKIFILAYAEDLPYMNKETIPDVLSITPTVPVKYEEWIRHINNLLGYTASYAYGTKWVSQQQKEEVIARCEELRSVFRRRIANLDWMSNTTKERAINKLDHMGINVGYPDNWVKEALVDISGCQTLVEAVRVIRQADVNLMTAIVGTSINENGFNLLLYGKERVGEDLRTFNAFYSLTINSLFIFPDFMLPPMYDLEGHEAMLYATCFFFGHELTHGFDSRGADYDEFGEFRNWWTVQDKMDFEARYQMLIDCYNRLELLPWDPDYHKYSPGEQTLSENIADLGGFEIARQAYLEKCQREGYYGEELDKQDRKYYQAFGNLMRAKYGSAFVDYYLFTRKDNHSMEKERTNGVVMNTDRWYELYNVQWGDNLYLRPEKRTHIW